MRTITVDTLEQLFKQTIAKLREEDYLEIPIKSDLYRFIPTDEWSNFANDVIILGSLHDDLDCLQLLITDSNHMMTYVDFDRISSVLRAISEELNPVNS